MLSDDDQPSIPKPPATSPAHGLGLPLYVSLVPNYPRPLRGRGNGVRAWGEGTMRPFRPVRSVNEEDPSHDCYRPDPWLIRWGGVVVIAIL